MQYSNESDPVTDTHLTEKEQRNLVEAVANSHSFHHSSTLKAFFVYVAEHALAGRLDEVKEQRIGFHVLGRKPDYDTANDNIVRIRARQVRQKLDEYFATEGRNSPWIITIPKGGYAPVFHLRSAVAAPAPAASVELHVVAQDVRTHSTAKSAHEADSSELIPLQTISKGASVGMGTRATQALPAWLPWVLAAGACLALCLIAWRDMRLAPEAPVPDKSNFWTQFFSAPGKQVTIVVADSGFAVWQAVTNRKENLADYVDRSFMRQPEGDALARHITTTPYTSLADVLLTLKVSQIAARLGGKVTVKHARNIDIHDLGSGDVILLGSSQSDPWVELFEPGMNFVLLRDSKTEDEYFQNRSPKPGEPETFKSQPIVGGRASEESYAVVAYLQNLSGSGHVLIIEGLDMEGTEAASEFVCNPANFASLLRAASATHDTPIKSFEAMIKLRAISGGYEALELAAFRYGPQPRLTAHNLELDRPGPL